MNLIFIGAMIAIGGGILSAIGTWLHNRSSSAKSTRIEEGVKQTKEVGILTNTEVTHLRKENVELISKADLLERKVEVQSEVIDNLRRENTDLHSKLANKALDIFNSVTGGNNYPEVKLGIFSGTNRIEFEVQNDSRFPIYDLVIDYQDPNKLAEILEKKKITEVTDADHKYYHVVNHIGNLSQNRFKQLLSYKMPINELKRFNFHMSTRNGEYIQLFDVTMNENLEFTIHGFLRKHDPTSTSQSKNIKTY